MSVHESSRYIPLTPLRASNPKLHAQNWSLNVQGVLLGGILLFSCWFVRRPADPVSQSVRAPIGESVDGLSALRPLRPATSPLLLSVQKLGWKNLMPWKGAASISQSCQS